MCPGSFHYRDLDPDHAALAARWRQEHVHFSRADRARDLRRFENAKALFETALAELEEAIRPGRNQPPCFTCDDPSGHAVEAPPGATHCPLCCEALFTEEEEDDGEVWWDSSTDDDDQVADVNSQRQFEYEYESDSDDSSDDDDDDADH